MKYKNINDIKQDISVENLGKLVNEFIDVLDFPQTVNGLEESKQNELKGIFQYLEGKGSISHDLYATLGSLVLWEIPILKETVANGGGKIFKEGLEKSIKILELCYNKDKKIAQLIQHLKLCTNSNFINHLSYDKDYKNLIHIQDEEIFLLAITDNLYKNAHRFTTDQSSIDISIREDGENIIISSSNNALQEFNKENKEIIISGQGKIMSQEGTNNTKGQGVYLIKLSQQLKKIGGKIDIIDTALQGGIYKTEIKVTIPKG